MEVKEKAKQLVDKFSPLVTIWDCYHDIPLDPDLILKDAKQCALIAVDEILNDYKIFNEKHKSYKVPGFWQVVRKEIELL